MKFIGDAILLIGGMLLFGIYGVCYIISEWWAYWSPDLFKALESLTPYLEQAQRIAEYLRTQTVAFYHTMALFVQFAGELFS